MFIYLYLVNLSAFNTKKNQHFKFDATMGMVYILALKVFLKQHLEENLFFQKV